MIDCWSITNHTHHTQSQYNLWFIKILYRENTYLEYYITTKWYIFFMVHDKVCWITKYCILRCILNWILLSICFAVKVFEIFTFCMNLNSNDQRRSMSEPTICCYNLCAFSYHNMEWHAIIVVEKESKINICLNRYHKFLKQIPPLSHTCS